MIKQLTPLILAAFLTQCTFVSPKALVALGTDMDDVNYTTNGAGGTCSFSSSKVNNSKAMAEVGKTVRFGIGWWGTAKVAESLAKGVESMAKGKTDLAVAEGNAEVGKINANAAATEGKIAAEAAAKAVPEAAPVQ